MLSESKENAIVQWHNCVSSSNNLSSLVELKDGEILRKDLEEIFEYQVRPLPSSAKSICFLKDSDARANFYYVKKYIDESLQIKSEDLANYEDCPAGNTTEIAIVTVLALSITVRHELERHDSSSLLTHLDIVTQYEIVECMSLVMEHADRELKRVEFLRILSRTAKFKERSIRFSNSPIKMVTTRKRGRKSKNVNSESPSVPSVLFPDDFPSPVMKMLETPKVKVWSTTAAKGRELFNLRRDLDAAENKIIDQRCMIAELRKDLDVKGEEYQLLKERHKKLQDDMDNIVLQNQSMDERMRTADINHNKVVEMYKTEIALLKQQVEAGKSTSDEMRYKLEHQQPKFKESISQEQLSEIQLQLQLTQEEKDRLAKEVETLQDNLKEMEEIASVYKDKLKEKEYDSSKLMDISTENMGDVLGKDYQVIREKLLNEELQNARLRKLLKAKIADCKELEARLKCSSLEKAISPKFLQASGAGHAIASKSEKKLSIERMWTSYDDGIENGIIKKTASGSLWASYDQKNIALKGEIMEQEHDSQSVCGNCGNYGGNSMNEIMLLAKQVFTAYGENRTLKLPSVVNSEIGHGVHPDGAGSYADSAIHVKYLLQELLREHSSLPSVKNALSDTEKSEEVSLDSGVNVALPAVQEHEARDHKGAQLLAACDDLRGQVSTLEAERQKLVDENASLRNFNLDAVKVKDEYEKENTQLTGNLKELTNKYARRKQELIEATALRKSCLKKYLRLKDYVVETEKELRASAETLKVYEIKIKAKQEQETDLRNNIKELQASLIRDKESRMKLSARVDFLQMVDKEMQSKKENAEIALANEIAKNKELTAKIEELKKTAERDAWSMKLPNRQDKIFIGVEHSENSEDTKSSIVRVNAVFGEKGNDSIHSGNYFNKSLHSTFVNDDEADIFNHSDLPRTEEESERERLRELERRNSLWMPHMRSAYPVETQGYESRKEAEAADGPKRKARGDSTAKRLPGIFKTPKSLHLLVQRREEERKRVAGIKKPRLKL